jgi:phosphohistidine phosphatase
MALTPQKTVPGYELYIMRHGKAVARGHHAYPDDSKRPLTSEGRKDLQKITKGMVRIGVILDWIVSSPLVRAQETAQIVAESLTPQVRVELSEALSPGGSAEGLLTFLGGHSTRQRTLLVGHEPDLSNLVCRLIGADPLPNLALKKGGCCLLIFAKFPQLSAGRLLWWATPKVLRSLA